MKISEIILLLERDGWRLKRISGSHRYFAHPDETRAGYRRGQAERCLETEDRVEHPEASGSAKGSVVKGYVVVFEGDDESGYSAYSPDLPGVIAAGDSRQETVTLMIEAMAAHIAMLRQEGQPVPEPSDAASVAILDPAAAA
jgi:predicted RNase H-like HicB family nuclease